MAEMISRECLLSFGGPGFSVPVGSDRSCTMPQNLHTSESSAIFSLQCEQNLTAIVHHSQSDEILLKSALEY